MTKKQRAASRLTEKAEFRKITIRDILRCELSDEVYAVSVDGSDYGKGNPTEKQSERLKMLALCEIALQLGNIAKHLKSSGLKRGNK